jgi:hypothetical protein
MTIFVKDIEDLLEAIKTLLENNLNTEIGKINTEKGDSLLDNFSSNEYFFYFRTKPALKKFINIYVGTVTVNPNGQETAQIAQVFVEIITRDDLTNDSYLKSLRYTTALRRTLAIQSFEIQNNWRITIDQMEPFSLPGVGQDIFPDSLVSGLRLTVDFI